MTTSAPRKQKKDFDPNNAVQTATGIWQNKSEVATQKAKVTNAE